MHTHANIYIYIYLYTHTFLLGIVILVLRLNEFLMVILTICPFQKNHLLFANDADF